MSTGEFVSRSGLLPGRKLIVALSVTVASVAAFARAGYTEADGFVTLTVDENSPGPCKQSLTTAGWWSDGLAPHSEPATNYYADGIGYYCPATFEGRLLVVGGWMRRYSGSTTWSTMEANPVEIPNLVMLGSKLDISSTANSGSRIAPYGSTNPTVFKGRLTISNSVDLVSGTVSSDGSNAGWTMMRMKLVGGADTCLRIHPDGAGSPGNAGIAKYRTGTFMAGDTTDFLGTVRVWFNQTLFLGDCGFPRATDVSLDSRGYSFLSTWATAGTDIPVSKITATASSTLVLPVSNRWTVATLDLAAGSKIDATALGAATDSDVGIVVTNAVTFGGKVKLDLSGITSVTPARVRILSVPMAAKTLTRDDFEITGEPDVVSGLEFEIQEVGDTWEACLVKNGDLPTLPSKFDASTGYVTLTKSDGNGCHSFYTAGNWSDGKAPHEGTNYYQGACNLYGGSPSAPFKGDRLVQTRYFRISGGATVTVGDWWLLPNGGANYSQNPNMITTEGAGAVTQTIGGTMTFFTTEAKPYCFLGGWDNNTWKITATLVGCGAGIILEGPTSRIPGQAHSSFTAAILGDTSRYYGTVSVNTNYTFCLGANGLPHAQVKILTEYSKLSGWEAKAMTIPVYRLVAQEAATVEALAGNEFRFGEIVAKKSITKTGAGTLAAGGTATVTSGATLTVSNGTLKVLSEDAFNGLPISFAAGTGLTVGGDAPLKTTGAVTAEGTVTVAIEGLDRSSPNPTVTLAKVPSASAAAFAAKLAVKRPRGYTVEAGPTVGTAGSDGLAPITVRLKGQGLAIYLK